MLFLPIAPCKCSRCLSLLVNCSHCQSLAPQIAPALNCSHCKLLPLRISPAAFALSAHCCHCLLLPLPFAPAAYCSRCLSLLLPIVPAAYRSCYLSLLLPISSAAYCSCFYRLHFISLPKLLPISLRCPLLLLLIASTADNSQCLLVLLHIPLCCLSLPVPIAFAACFQKSPTVGTLKLMVALPPTPRKSGLYE